LHEIKIAPIQTPNFANTLCWKSIYQKVKIAIWHQRNCQ